jgi:PKD repeat protein
VTGSHLYAMAGVYAVTLTVTDDEGAAGEAQFRYVVVFDPEGGFVTGGGWITSPPGAYVLDPTLTGRANFGFVSKYKRGSSVPTGTTEFQFHAAGFNFRSTSYQWLVVAGAKAKFKGEGEINGSGSYGFMLSATDGALPGGGGSDKFRIKIWDKATDVVVYDNELGAPDDADPTTVIGGGSIVIHQN